MKIWHYLYLSVFIVSILGYIRIRRKKGLLVQKNQKQKTCTVTTGIRSLKLARAQISSTGSCKFARILSDTIRNYIRFAYKVEALNITSEELINKLLRNPSTDLYIIGLLAEVMKIADSAKYSERKLSILQQKGIYKKACRFMLLSERHFRNANSKCR